MLQMTPPPTVYLDGAQMPAIAVMLTWLMLVYDTMFFASLSKLLTSSIKVCCEISCLIDTWHLSLSRGRGEEGQQQRAK